MRSFIIAIIFLTIADKLSAQLVIGTGSIVKVNGTMVITGGIKNQSSNAQLLAADVSLSGTDQTLSTVTPVALNSLSVVGGGTKTLEGQWEVQNTLELNDGVVVVGSAAKLIYSGTQALTGSSTSYVNGYFYYKGSGQLFFPVGTSGNYTPMVINNAAGGPEYGVRAVAGDAGFALPPDVKASFTGHYWELSTAPNSTISLSIDGMETLLQEGSPVVLQAQAVGGVATSLSGTVNNTLVTSESVASQTIVGVGVSPEFTLIIHDMITPFTQDEVNDKLVIENIDLTESNKVTFIDRYGVVVKEWTNYTSDIEFDFQRFSPGNYICVVEYVAPGSSTKFIAKGNVTVLKSK
jgi:hypothetical protein